MFRAADQIGGTVIVNLSAIREGSGLLTEMTRRCPSISAGLSAITIHWMTCLISLASVGSFRCRFNQFSLETRLSDCNPTCSF